jgi:hypothetical protein
VSYKNWLTVVVLSLVVGPAAVAHADCAAPSSPGLKICFPNEGSSVMYVPALEMAVNTASGNVSRVEVWTNGTKRDGFNYLPGTLYDGSMKNGWNRVTVKVWDTDGHTYQAVRSFHVTGYGVGSCATPTGPGVNLCWPLTGSWQANNAVPISASARGLNSKIKYVNIYVDGKFLVGQSTNNIQTGSGVSAGTHTVTARAVDFAGHVFTSSHKFNAFYNFDCNPKSGECSPGVVINTPTGPDVPTSFTLQADVQNNPRSITAMKVYVDGVEKVSNNGPGISAELNFAKNSTHIVWVKAWDSAGKVYATYQTYYAQ